jgi:hypothetical protein
VLVFPLCHFLLLGTYCCIVTHLLLLLGLLPNSARGGLPQPLWSSPNSNLFMTDNLSATTQGLMSMRSPLSQWFLMRRSSRTGCWSVTMAGN